jgi:hypothetical protein
LWYAEIPPVEVISDELGDKVWEECATDTLKKIKQDVTRSEVFSLKLTSFPSINNIPHKCAKDKCAQRFHLPSSYVVDIVMVMMHTLTRL